MSTVFLNQLLRIEVTVQNQDGAIINLATSTSRTFEFRKPNGISVSKTALFVTDGTDGKLYYSTGPNDLDEIGEWTMQAVIVDSGGDYPTDIIHINVSKRV